MTWQGIHRAKINKPRTAWMDRRGFTGDNTAPSVQDILQELNPIATRAQERMSGPASSGDTAQPKAGAAKPAAEETREMKSFSTQTQEDKVKYFALANAFTTPPYTGTQLEAGLLYGMPGITAGYEQVEAALDKLYEEAYSLPYDDDIGTQAWNWRKRHVEAQIPKLQEQLEQWYVPPEKELEKSSLRAQTQRLLPLRWSWTKSTPGKKRLKWSGRRPHQRSGFLSLTWSLRA